MKIQILDVADGYADFLHDESRREGRADRIVFPNTTEEVGEAMALASKNSWPVTVQGGRTGITGGCVPDGGLILNLSRMNRIGAIEQGRLSVQAGAVLDNIRSAIAGSGYFFPTDPTETSANIGGMVSTNASGARSYRYGAVRPWISGLVVVLASGEVVKLERGIDRAAGLAFVMRSISGTLPEIPQPCNVKSAAGYFSHPDMDLVDLFIGAEGTLGIVAEVSLALLPEPDAICGLTAFFRSEAAALYFVGFLRACTQPLAIEFFDARSLDLLRRMKAHNPAFSDLPELDPEYHTALYFEFEGEPPDAVAAELEQHAVDCWVADNERAVAVAKRFRHAVPEAVNQLVGERKRLLPTLTKLGTDMAVPDGRLEDAMRMYREGLAAAGLEYVVFGHIGNNHLHVNILPRSLAEYEQGTALYLEWARQVVSMGGSVSAEHGIGKLKTEFLKLMFGDDGIQKMRGIKACLDPSFLLNRGNLFPLQ